jgi:hypothetical protein
MKQASFKESNNGHRLWILRMSVTYNGSKEREGVWYYVAKQKIINQVFYTDCSLSG